MTVSGARRKVLTIGLAADGVLCGIAAHTQGALATVCLARWLLARVSGNDLLLAAGILVGAAVIVISFLAEWSMRAQSVKEAPEGD